MKTIEDIVRPKKKAAPKTKNTRAVQHFLRNSYRTHIAMSSLADRKANIMIRLNSILISVLLVFFKEIADITPVAMISASIFLLTSLISLAFATASARPEITKLHHGPFRPEIIKHNIFFFGNYVHLEREQYEEAFEEMMKEKDLVYGNMIRDLFHLGGILDKKFRYLKWSYNTFLVGLILTVSSFLISIMYSNVFS